MSEQTNNWNIANVLTVLRIGMVPAFAYLLLVYPHDPGLRLVTTSVFALAILTDFIDGKIARRYNLVTDFGKLWDPIADKALTGMAFVGLSVLGELPWWITITILVREWGITALRAAIVKYGVMAANRGGKLKTATQSLALTLFLLWLPQLPQVVQWSAWTVMIAALVLTVLTGFDYLREAARLRRSALERWAEEGRPDGL